jgi:hypothetical protein
MLSPSGSRLAITEPHLIIFSSLLMKTKMEHRIGHANKMGNNH